MNCFAGMLVEASSVCRTHEWLGGVRAPPMSVEMHARLNLERLLRLHGNEVRAYTVPTVHILCGSFVHHLTGMSAQACSLCTNNYNVQNPPDVQHCGHAYHTACVFDWRKRSHGCPLCRREVTQALARRPIVLPAMHGVSTKVGMWRIDEEAAACSNEKWDSSKLKLR